MTNYYHIKVNTNIFINLRNIVYIKNIKSSWNYSMLLNPVYTSTFAKWKLIWLCEPQNHLTVKHFNR